MLFTLWLFYKAVEWDVQREQSYDLFEDAGIPLAMADALLHIIAATDEGDETIPDAAAASDSSGNEDQAPCPAAGGAGGSDGGDGGDDDEDYEVPKKGRKLKAKDRRAQQRGEQPRDGTPGNNQAQNKQFRDASRGLDKAQKRRLHDELTGRNLNYHEIKELAEAIKRGEL